MLALVGVHVAGVLLSSWLHRENLVARDGHRPQAAARREEGIRSAWRSVAALMLVAVLGFWWLQWQNAPAGGGWPARRRTSAQHGGHDHDDD